MYNYKEQTFKKPQMVQDFLDKHNEFQYVGMLRNGLRTLFFVNANERDVLPMSVAEEYLTPLYVFLSKLGTRRYFYFLTEQGVVHYFDFAEQYLPTINWKELRDSILFTTSMLSISNYFNKWIQIGDKNLQMWKDMINKKYLLDNYKSELEIQLSILPDIEELDEESVEICRVVYGVMLKNSIKNAKPIVLESEMGPQLFAYIPKDTKIIIYEDDEMGICVAMEEG